MKFTAKVTKTVKEENKPSKEVLVVFTFLCIENKNIFSVSEEGKVVIFNIKDVTFNV